MKIRTLIIAAMLTIVAFFTTTASAKEVDRALAANPSAVLSEINEMNLPALSDQEAGKIRGEVLWFGILLEPYAYYYGVPTLALLTKLTSNPGWPRTVSTVISTAQWLVSHPSGGGSW